MKKVVRYSNIIDVTAAAKEPIKDFIATKYNSYNELEKFTIALDLNKDCYLLIDKYGIVTNTIHAKYTIDFIEEMLSANYNLYLNDED